MYHMLPIHKDTHWTCRPLSYSYKAMQLDPVGIIDLVVIQMAYSLVVLCTQNQTSKLRVSGCCFVL